MPTDVFALPDRLAAKADPSLIGRDRAHFAAVAEQLRLRLVGLAQQLALLRSSPGGRGRGAVDRDMEIHRLTGQLRMLQRYGLDVCLGRMVRAGDPEPVYLGRIGLTDGADGQLLLDWRTPAAEPFFAATPAEPMGLVSRRRYRWGDGRIRDYWDEVLAPGPIPHDVALDDDSAFLASLGASRSPRMRDVLSTIQAEQDAIIRAGSRGALVVDGGPGTGKTVVALHRAAYLLYADPRLSGQRGGVLVVGPHQPFLSYISDVLPGLGEEGVQACTLRDLLPEGTAAVPETDPEVSRLKSSAAMVGAIEPAVALYEEPPATGLAVETDWSDFWLTPTDWAEAFDAPDPGTPHNEARDVVWEALLDIVVDKFDDEEVEEELVRSSLLRNDELKDTFRRAWPILDPDELVGDLWSVPAYLRRCAPWLTREQVLRLQRAEPTAWTVADLPLLDAARQRIGDPRASVRRRRLEAERAAQREYMDPIVDYLLATDDDPESTLIMLRGDDLRRSLLDDDAVPGTDPDVLAGPFAHVIVDEAQELTDAEWQLLVRRCPSRSFTIVGDRAQARHGFAATWRERLEPLGFREVRVATLDVNYRTPAEVMAEAEPVIRAELPDANVPISIRRNGLPVVHGSASGLHACVDEWLAGNPEGTACVIGAPEFAGTERVRSLTPETVKGLEFDLVVLVNPESFPDGIEGAVDRYVSMTRTTRRLVVLSDPEGGETPRRESIPGP